MHKFKKHHGFNKVLKRGKMTLGLSFPLEDYRKSVPKMDLATQVERAKLAEEMGFAALWARDIPLNDTVNFGDAGQMYDPWIFQSYIAAHTEEIALGMGSIITTFRHPIDIAKSAASLDRISGERLLLGLATGDRPIEFDAYRVDKSRRAEIFRETFHVIKRLWHDDEPRISTEHVNIWTGDMLPKPALYDIPVFVTGSSSQTHEWIAENGDGWMTYPRARDMQEIFIGRWRQGSEVHKPFIQSLSLDLHEDPDYKPQQIHLGFRTGINYLKSYLQELEEMGVDHVMLGLKFSKRPVDEVIQEIGEEIIKN
ncbi:LLM class oxidoreductase [Salinicoccus halitifaciens]|uniref:Luciferase-type oxidoreductase n=1 Tax=Salinicoccus halitifaciens TaxID=1073415 RepID=A0ABV2EE65_9STAP|nr:LLM class oxidoreductase [Salinicoccus halitifaciens]MCD2138749.1 LLM class oxidoreductase [Salinicoccus halitifaciens]